MAPRAPRDPDKARAGRDKGVARSNKRASREAVDKRRAARAFNELLLGSGPSNKLDGRSEKRRKRMLEELGSGQLRASGRELKPIEVLIRVSALLDLGEPLSSIKKVCRTPRAVEASASVIAGVKRLHAAYRFPPEAYLFVGIDEVTLSRAGVSARPALASAKVKGGASRHKGSIGRSSARAA